MNLEGTGSTPLVTTTGESYPLASLNVAQYEPKESGARALLLLFSRNVFVTLRRL